MLYSYSIFSQQLSHWPSVSLGVIGFLLNNYSFDTACSRKLNPYVETSRGGFRASGDLSRSVLNRAETANNRADVIILSSTDRDKESGVTKAVYS